MEFSPLSRRTMLLRGASGILAFSYVPPLPALAHSGTTVLRPEMFGAMGDGGDDTEGLLALTASVNRAGSGHIVFTAGKTYRLAHRDQRTPCFRHLDWLSIEGNGAILLTADRGCPTASLGCNWGQINFENCRNVDIAGLIFDGNRRNQLHTSGAPDGVGFNAGLNFWSPPGKHSTSNVGVRSCHFRNHGTLTNSTDVRGDGIFAHSGIRDLRIDGCLFERVGRWAFALAEGQQPSEGVYFTQNEVRNEDRGRTGNRPWGAVDIEDTGLPNRDVFIQGNRFAGTAQVAYSGFAASAGSVTVEGTYIRHNTWDIPDGDTATNVPFTLASGLPGRGTYRHFRHLVIEDNVVRWKGAGQTTHLGHSAKLEDVSFRRNSFIADAATATSDRGLTIGYGGHLVGEIDISDNQFTGLGEALANANRWHCDPSPRALTMFIERNLFRRCYRAFNLQFSGCTALPRTSHIVFRGNRSVGTRSDNGEYVDGGPLSVEFHDAKNEDKVWKHLHLNTD